MDSSRDWELIANYESFELIKRDYESRHGRTPNTQHAREIVAPFSHAKSYFRSARAAELTVKPLLLYYGVVSLSRGLTLLLSRGLREAALTPSHGLSTKDWSVGLNGDKPNFVGLRMSVTGGGTLPDLSRATGQRSLLRAGSSAVNFKFESPLLAAGAEFTLGDLLSREPALQEHHLRWTNETNCAPISTEKDAQSGQVTLKLLKYGKTHLNRSVADRILRGTPYQYVSEDETCVQYRGPNSTTTIPGLTDHVRADQLGIGDVWVTGSFESGLRLSKISALFGLSYALGMLVRYFPTQWNALVRGQIGDAPLPTVSAAVDFIETSFPAAIVDFLQEKPGQN